MMNCWNKCIHDLLVKRVCGLYHRETLDGVDYFQNNMDVN